MADSYIFDAIRSPRGRGKVTGALHEVTSLSISAQMLEAIRDRNNIDTSLIDDVVFGCVTPIGEQGANIARSAVLAAGYSQNVSGVQINRFCASGLEAVNMASNKVKSGEADFVIGGGVEMMSRVPMGYDGGAIAVDPLIAIKNYIVPQGISADTIATKYNISRQDCDEYAFISQKRAAKSWEEGRFKSIVPIKDQMGQIILDKDELIRPNTSIEELAKLEPSFKIMGEVMPAFDKVIIQKYPELKKIDHVHHAGNSSAIADGAAAVLVGSLEAGQKSGLKPRAKIVATASIGSEPSIMLTGPEFVTKKVLTKAGINIQDIDIIELNEAFASVVLRFMQALDVDIDKINVCGGAIAMGHPLGATGAMILGTALDELERSGKKTALICLCVGVGMGTATIIERI